MITTAMVLTEMGVLGVFLVGIVTSRVLRRRWHPSEILVMYALGLLFEMLTAHFWEYQDIFLVFPFEQDISVLFPLGWAGLIMTATSFAEHLWARFGVQSRLRRHLLLMACWLVVGNTAEIIFYNAGMIEYLRGPRSEINFILGQVPYLPPFMVLVGYGMGQPFVSHFFRWMEGGLSAPQPGDAQDNRD